MPIPSNTSTPVKTLPASFAAPRPSLCYRQAVLALAVALIVALTLASPLRALAQAVAAPASITPFAMSDLRVTLTTVQNATTAANISRWKIPSDAKANAQQDVASVQRDIATTLPGLMSTAEAAPQANGVPALAPTFAVFRNLDALYDVLLRVSETARLGAPATDAGSLESARAALESSRGKLGAWLLDAIGAQDAQYAQAIAAAARPAAPPPPPNKIVVDDGPETPKPRKKKTTPPPAPQ